MASSQCLILPRAKGRFASAASVRKRQVSSMHCKIINASRENTSSTEVHDEKLGEREREDAESLSTSSFLQDGGLIAVRGLDRDWRFWCEFLL